MKLQYNEQLDVIEYADEKFMQLNRGEQSILAHLIKNRVATKETLEQLFALNQKAKEKCNSVEVYIHRINKKLEPYFKKKVILKRPKINYYLTIN